MRRLTSAATSRETKRRELVFASYKFFGSCLAHPAAPAGRRQKTQTANDRKHNHRRLRHGVLTGEEPGGEIHGSRIGLERPTSAVVPIVRVVATDHRRRKNVNAHVVGGSHAAELNTPGHVG